MGLLSRRGVVAVAFGIALSGLSAGVSAAPAGSRLTFSDEAVEKAIAQAKAYIWSQYIPSKGHWPERPPHPNTGEPYINFGGQTALSVYALLASGELYTEPRLKRAIDWMAGIKTTGTYFLGLRTQVWLYLPRTIALPLLKKDAETLMLGVQRPGMGLPTPKSPGIYGSYTYQAVPKPRNETYDHSNSQFGVLGVWAAARAGLEIPQGYWQLIYDHWVKTQNTDGGWSYSAAKPQTKDTMVAVGLATVFVANNYLHQHQFVRCGANPDLPVITKGLAWMDKNFYEGGQYERGSKHYYLYGAERVGLASGYKYFGRKDWYKLGVEMLINTQQADGSWPYHGMEHSDLTAAGFALLFLARGRNPVVLNRLEYPGDWNNRPHALGNFTRWLQTTFEREVSWQIITLKAPVEEWHDSGVLLVSGAKAPALEKAHLDKVRTFVQQGGRILSIAECGPAGAGFDQGMRKWYAELFPQYELTRLPPDHPIHTLHFKLRKPPAIWGLSNGGRYLAFHTTDDLLQPMQINAHITGMDAFQTGFNILYYANSRQHGRPRGTTAWPAASAAPTTRSVKVLRVKHPGNWDPEPLALERFRLLMAADWKTKVTVADPAEPEALNAADCRVAVMTGTNRLGLSPAQEQALKRYVQAGGTVIMDAAGGSNAFADSAVQLLERLFGEGAVKRLASSAPVFQLPDMRIDEVGYRTDDGKSSPTPEPPRLYAVSVGDRPAVFLSREDLTVALVGCPAYETAGYQPGSAARIMRNLVLYAAGTGK